ncbi:hypothetical protein B0T22DRAFT_443686 [Podospora appendiculata]|uniref:2EXR domain-containing protein n=1 Tax=Podospora appendiculata TaxID=314037 RepID=A0AAE0X2S4_9PEZI|nr:hypothetical protein B0T22DRAFT_443686 [Podospora appendiculata]
MPTTFPLFAQLPFEVRYMIWDEVPTPKRIIGCHFTVIQYAHSRRPPKLATSLPRFRLLRRFDRVPGLPAGFVAERAIYVDFSSDVFRLGAGNLDDGPGIPRHWPFDPRPLVQHAISPYLQHTGAWGSGSHMTRALPRLRTVMVARALDAAAWAEMEKKGYAHCRVVAAVDNGRDPAFEVVETELVPVPEGDEAPFDPACPVCVYWEAQRENPWP